MPRLNHSEDCRGGGECLLCQAKRDAAYFDRDDERDPFGWLADRDSDHYERTVLGL